MDKIKVALCSFGMSGRVFHAPFIDMHGGYTLYAVWERQKELSREVYPNVKIVRDFDELLFDQEVDLVVVNTPNVTHYPFVKAALCAGKHVVVEKPFTTTYQEAMELVALAKDKDCKLAVYHNRRYDSDFLTVKRILESGVLGPLVEAELHFDRYVPALSAKLHKELPTSGVGSLYDLGSHLVDQALQLFGMPSMIQADIGALREQSQVDDYFDIKLWYPSHRVSLRSSYFVKEALPAYIIHGKKGSFIKSKADPQEANLVKGLRPDSKDWGVEVDGQEGLLHAESNGGFVRQHVTSERGDYGRFYAQLFEALQGRAPLPVTAEEGALVIKIIEAAYQSHLEGRRLPL